MGFPLEIRERAHVEIYQYTRYDRQSEKMVLSKRWGTKAKIDELCAFLIEDTRTLVDASAVKSDVPGLTAIGYTPPA